MSAKNIKVSFVCPSCFDQDSLRQRLRELQPQDAQSQSCDIRQGEPGVPLSEVAAIVDEVFREYYIISSDGDSIRGDGDLVWCLADLTHVTEYSVAEALAEYLIKNEHCWPPDGDEPFYADTEQYSSDSYPSNKYDWLWRSFCNDIVYNQRFFNSNARTTLSKIFENVHLQKDLNGNSPIYTIMPGTEQSSFYRARVIEHDAQRREIAEDPALHLGPPPARLRRAGRMNSAGISAFYGAFDLDTCISELRPAVGSLVVGAKFEITEELCVLDMTQFVRPRFIHELFARNQITLASQWHFMKDFMHEISQPISPSDEHLDYIPTQAVAEYLSKHYEFDNGGKKMRIQAVIYNSAQHTQGKNIVILGEAAHVGMPGSAEDKDPADPITDWLAERKNIRIIPKLGSMETRRVSGAAYTSTPYPGDMLDDEIPF